MAFSRFLRKLLAALSSEDACFEPADSPEPSAAHSAGPAEHMDTFWVDERLPLVAHVEDPLRESAHVLGPRAYAGILGEAVRAAGTPPHICCGWLQVRSAAFWYWHGMSAYERVSRQALVTAFRSVHAWQAQLTLSTGPLVRPRSVTPP